MGPEAPFIGFSWFFRTERRAEGPKRAVSKEFGPKAQIPNILRTYGNLRITGIFFAEQKIPVILKFPYSVRIC